MEVNAKSEFYIDFIAVEVTNLFEEALKIVGSNGYLAVQILTNIFFFL